MDKPLYLNWLVEELGVVFEDGKSLNCYKLSYELNDEILDNWSLHLRRHYENDEDLVESACLNNRSVKDYLREMVIPQKEDNFGPTSRSNDISEILFADLFKFILGYEVPRCKQYNRSGKTQSEHGTDILAYKFYSPKKTFHIKDELVAIEVKAGLGSSDADKVISEAVKDSKKDEKRVLHTINYYRKKLKACGKTEESKEITRFLSKAEYPYDVSFVAAAISSKETIKNNVIVGIKGEDLELKTNQSVFYVHGADLMNLTHQVFDRCDK